MPSEDQHLACTKVTCVISFASLFLHTSWMRPPKPQHLPVSSEKKEKQNPKRTAQDTETGIDVCKLSEKNFLRTLGMLSVSWWCWLKRWTVIWMADGIDRWFTGMRSWKDWSYNSSKLASNMSIHPRCRERDRWNATESNHLQNVIPYDSLQLPSLKLT